MRIAGYKWLCVEAFPDDARGITLRSAFDAHLWTRGTNVANYPPSEENLWGFNAYHSAVRARWSGRNYGTVIVGVVGFGTVALFQHGWRAEKAEIVAVHLRGVSRIAGDWERAHSRHSARGSAPPTMSRSTSRCGCCGGKRSGGGCPRTTSSATPITRAASAADAAT